MRIAIVNDLVIAIEALRRIVLTSTKHEVIWVAKTGTEAVNKCRYDRPDLILMDLILPDMDGVVATRQIMQTSPCAILIVTASVAQNSAKVFEAMGYGALDAVNTPVLGSQASPEATRLFIQKITTIEKLTRKPHSQATTFQPTALTVKLPLIAIGASTGGPKVLATLLARLPQDFAAAIVIVQHIDQQFAIGLVDWLNQQTSLSVKKASAGDRPEKGVALVACTNDHLHLTANGTLHYTAQPLDYPYRPSVDVFFKSIARYWTPPGTAILLTGMGRDGAEGLSLLRQKSWYTIAQNKESCVVNGMPKAAIDLNAAIDILNPEAIATAILHRSQGH